MLYGLSQSLNIHSQVTPIASFLGLIVRTYVYVFVFVPLAILFAALEDQIN